MSDVVAAADPTAPETHQVYRIPSYPHPIQKYRSLSPAPLLQVNVQVQDWPLIPANTVSDGVVQRLGAVFFFCAAMVPPHAPTHPPTTQVIFISTLSGIVSEKEKKLRIALEMMGLWPRYVCHPRLQHNDACASVFWMSNLLSYSLLVFVNALVTVLLGMAFQFSAFLNTFFFVCVCRLDLTHTLSLYLFTRTHALFFAHTMPLITHSFAF